MRSKRDAAPAAEKTSAKKAAAPKAAPHYDTFEAMMKAKAKGAIPRGAKVKEMGGNFYLVDSKGEVISTEFAAVAVAAWLMRKAGLKVEVDDDDD